MDDEKKNMDSLHSENNLEGIQDSGDKADKMFGTNVESGEDTEDSDISESDDIWIKDKHFEEDEEDEDLDFDLELPTDEIDEQDITDDPVRIYREKPRQAHGREQIHQRDTT
jgi:hypothetical protein